jgi:hypothetical protein
MPGVRVARAGVRALALCCGQRMSILVAPGRGSCCNVPMSIAPNTLPQAVSLVHVRPPAPTPGSADAQQRERGRRLYALQDHPDALDAAVLACLLTPRSALDVTIWRSLVSQPDALTPVREDVEQLSSSQRLPWFEHFARALARGPVARRQALIGAARRLLTADRVVTPMDQLRWIALRHLLAGSAVAPPAALAQEFETLDGDQVHSICVYAGFLSALVPTPEVHFDPTGYGSVSQQWYDTVTAPWADRADVPAREGYDIDAALRALRELQAMPWLLRPMLVRTWFDAARALTDGPRLHAASADALRLSCVLLDSPMPPELGQQYIEVDPIRH